SVFGYAEVGDYYQYDPAKARQLLADAGFGDGLKLTLHYQTGRYVRARELTEAIAGYLREVGIQAEPRAVEEAVMRQLTSAESPEAAAASELDMRLLSAVTSSRDAHYGLYPFVHT